MLFVSSMFIVILFGGIVLLQRRGRVTGVVYGVDGVDLRRHSWSVRALSFKV